MNDDPQKFFGLSTHVCNDQRLPKEEIIKKGAVFSKVIRTGKRWQGKTFNIYYLRHEERKAGFTVPKKLGKAHNRNFAKRRLREMYRRHRCLINPYYLVFIPKPTILHLSFQKIEQDFLLFLHQTEVGVSQVS